MHWKKQSPAVTSSRINFYYQPSMDEVASMLVSSTGSFNFEYVEQINAEQQFRLLEHFETIYDCYPETRETIEKLLIEIPFGANAKCNFIICNKRYKKFSMLNVDRVTEVHHLVSMAEDWLEFPDDVESILVKVLLAKGQGSKIDGAVKQRDILIEIFKRIIPRAINLVDECNDPVSLARNISKTKAEVDPEYFDKLEAAITMRVLSDNLQVKTQTANTHMKNIRKAEVQSV